MVRIWARTMVETKITRSYIYECIDNFREEDFRTHIEKMCHELDIPTPVIIKSHIDNFVNFNNTVFSKSDFIEYIDFDKLIIENAVLSKWHTIRYVFFNTFYLFRIWKTQWYCLF